MVKRLGRSPWTRRVEESRRIGNDGRTPPCITTSAPVRSAKHSRDSTASPVRAACHAAKPARVSGRRPFTPGCRPTCIADNGPPLRTVRRGDVGEHEARSPRIRRRGDTEGRPRVLLSQVRERLRALRSNLNLTHYRTARKRRVECRSMAVIARPLLGISDRVLCPRWSRSQRPAP
jgi:hypothetical protein